MTDKQIIDCEYLLKIDEMRTCKALNVSFYSDIICNEGNCIILKLKQQLKAKEQECEELKETLKTKAKGWANVNDKILEEVDQLKAENEELKEKINSLVCSENCYKYKQAEKLKQTLAEIKEIAEKQCNICEAITPIDEYKDCKKCWQGVILQKISEVENER